MREARYIRSGEMVAIHSGALHSGPQGMFWLLNGTSPPNERKGDVAVVYVHGELEHHSSMLCDSYEDIVCRVECAVEGEDEAPPSTLVLCIDSPGGVVAGLNECVSKLRKISRDSKVKFVAYANEMAASAAYAISCACQQIVCPPSAIIGSIGVISTVVSQARKNEMDGIDVVYITSGERKADGHVHAPITAGVIAAERSRLQKTAASFFKLAGDARGIKPATIESYQANIFLGADAKKRKLVDRVMSLDDLVSSLNPGEETPSVAAGGNQTDRRLQMARLTHLGPVCQASAAHVAHLIPRRP